ncbi:MAG: hypothetical protein J5595_10595, partial [Bacteroidales bacterium]|nr:hypothetical protein [Bacteroidales bacterium]
MQNINIALSDTCAHLAEKFTDCRTVDFRSGAAIAEFFEAADKPCSLLIFVDVTPHDTLPELNKYSA